MNDKVDTEGRISVFDIKVPLALALGQYEQLTKEEIDEHFVDIRAERERRIINGE